MSVMLVNGFYIDNNRNSWASKMFSYEQAAEYSKSLEKCSGCTNCRDCKYCYNCIRNEGCSYCENCRECNNSNHLSSCIKCSSCFYCATCTNCSGCYYLIDAKNQVDAKNFYTFGDGEKFIFYCIIEGKVFLKVGNLVEINKFLNVIPNNVKLFFQGSIDYYFVKLSTPENKLLLNHYFDMKQTVNFELR